MVRAPLLALCLALAACSPPAPDAARRAPGADVAVNLPAMKRFGGATAPQTSHSNAALARDFMELVFQLESGRAVPRLSRFEGPITLRLTGSVPATVAADTARLIARLRAEAGIDIREVGGNAPASITVQFLPRARMQSLVPQAACFVVPRIGSWEEYRRSRGGAAVDWTTLDARERATVFVPADTAPQDIRDCLHEEIAQALGPLNDLYRLPESVFNDDNFHGVLTGFDMLILRAYYAPELQNGMDSGTVATRLPAIFARINPQGGAGGFAGPDPTPRVFVDAIETALGSRAPAPKRRVAAIQAVSIANGAGWQDSRAGFAYFALGRLSISTDVNAALESFAAARDIYRAQPDMEVQAAHVDMQLAAFALSSGRADDALRLVARAIPSVMASENAALLSTLLMVRAQALDMIGKPEEARAVQTEALGWARYGFGSDAEVRRRLIEIVTLADAGKARIR